MDFIHNLFTGRFGGLENQNKPANCLQRPDIELNAQYKPPLCGRHSSRQHKESIFKRRLPCPAADGQPSMM